MIFEGRPDQLLQLLTLQMKDHSNKQEFEKAGLIRDQIKGIEQISQAQKVTSPDSSVSRDVIGLSSNKNIY